ncbi:MAG: hypothetical protein H9533_00915 [Rhodobacteraceae bacterium]|nr:hypothetical protein [Paracoccaceae bacterium]
MPGFEWWQRLSKSRAQQRAARVGLHALTTPELAYVENGIRPVVDVLNRFGLTTVASCEGHAWRSMQPYVMFRAPVGTAGRIERFLREEEVNASSNLRSSWFVVPAFDGCYELAFSIVGRGGVAQPTLLGLFSSPRKRLDSELRRLAEKLEAVLEQMLHPKIRCSKANQEKNYTHSSREVCASAKASMRVGCVAARTFLGYGRNRFATRITALKMHRYCQLSVNRSASARLSRRSARVARVVHLRHWRIALVVTRAYRPGDGGVYALSPVSVRSAGIRSKLRRNS